MKIIIRPSHNMGMRHAYVMVRESTHEFALYSSLCGKVVRRSFRTNADTGNTHPIECQTCKRKFEKIGESL